jgi:RecA-family ATPase
MTEQTSSPFDLALAYIERGWNPTPVPLRSKRPTGANWHLRTINAETAGRYFDVAPMNIGIVLGPSSGGLTDVDLDCAEAIAVAPYILPRTGAMFGRPSKRSSHWLYYTELSVTPDQAAAQRFVDPVDKATLLELRIGGDKGAQTVFPGSVHESGELIAWESGAAGEPASADNLEQLVHCLAAYALLARRWPQQQSSRHHLALVLGGFLARAGLEPSQVKLAAEAITRAAGDEEWRDRRQAAEDAAKAFHNGERAHGYPSLRDAFGDDVAARVAEWLDYNSAADNAASGTVSGTTSDHNETTPEQKEKLPPLPFIDMSNWDNEPRPEREWAVRDRIPLRQTALFSGEGGAGKSNTTLHLCCAHALGRDWLRSMPEPGPAIFIDAEDDDKELHIRACDIADHYQVKFSDLIAGGLKLLSFVGKDAVLATVSRNGKVEPTPLYRQILEEAGDTKPKMIGIAASANVFAGAENDRSQVQQFVSLLTRIAIRANGSVQLISHPSLTGINTDSGLSGSTQWHNAVRARSYIRAVKAEQGEQPDSDLREIVFKKNQYGPLGETVVVRYQNGLFLPVLGVGSLDSLAQQERAQEVFLALLKRFRAANRNVFDKRGTGYAPALFAVEAEAKKAMSSNQALAAAMRKLFEDGKIWNEPHGRPSRQSYRIAIKGA